MEPVTEQELKAKAVAPRVTLEEVEGFIASEVLFTVGDALKDCPVSDATKLLTMCVLTLKNGFTVTGESACADPANFNADVGKRLARAAAVNKIWPLLGFELRTKLALIDAAGPATGAIVSLLGSRPLTYVGTKVVRAVPMSRGEYNRFRGWELPASENLEDAGYLIEYTEGGDTNIEGFAGYVSWTPKSVFEKAYTVSGEPRATTFLDRMRVEHRETKARYEKLMAFIPTPAFAELPAVDQRDLKTQRDTMEELVWILNKRIQRAELAK